MSIYHRSAEYLDNYIDLFNSSDLVVLDTPNTNLGIESLKYMASISLQNHFKLCVNTVSITKAKRVLPIFSNISVLSSNVSEVEQLVDHPINTTQEAIDAGRCLISWGVKEVIITQCEQGIVYCNSQAIYDFDAIHTNTKDATGAGDAFFAGYLSSRLNGHDIVYSLKYGLVLAAQNIASSNNVHIPLSSVEIKNRIYQYYQMFLQSMIPPIYVK